MGTFVTSLLSPNNIFKTIFTGIVNLDLSIISEKIEGSIETKIKRLPLSYTITQKTKINGGEEKVTHEEEVHGHACSVDGHAG